jgi:hypothetical protein
VASCGSITGDSGNGDPGTDQCGANHMNNVKYLTGTTMSVDGGAGEDITDTNLTAIECTIKVNFSDAASVALSSVLFYCYDGTTPATRHRASTCSALSAARLKRQVEINDDSGAQGGTGNGDSFESRSAATSHDYFVALSASPETVGAKTAFDFGMSLVYS